MENSGDVPGWSKLITGARPGKNDLVPAFSSWSSLPLVHLMVSLLAPSEAPRLDTQLPFGSTAIEVATVGYNL